MGRYLDLPDARIHYQAHGTAGETAVLLHGMLGAGFVWDPYIAGLAERYRLVVPDLRGRGRSPDLSGTFGFDDQVADIVALVDAVVGEPVHLVGYSDGGIIGILLGLAHADRLRSLVLIGANYHHDGLADRSFFDRREDDPAFDMPRTKYAELSPDGPEHWPAVFAGLMAVAQREPELSDADVRAIDLPTLVMVGDHDIIALDHTTALYRALPQGQLAIVPDATHAVAFERPDIVMALIGQFLDRLERPR